MFDGLTERLTGVFDRLSGRGVLSREGRRRGAARGARRAAGGRRRPAGGARLHRQGQGGGRRRGGDPLGPARRPGGQDRLRRPGRDAGRRGARAAAPGAQPADRDPDGRPAGLRQDHHDRQAGAAPGEDRAQEGADRLARHPPPGRHGAAGDPGQAGRGREPADRAPARRAPDIARRALSAARLGGYDVAHPRHRRAHHARRGDDERGGRDRPHRPARPRPCWWPTASPARTRCAPPRPSTSACRSPAWC